MWNKTGVLHMSTFKYSLRKWASFSLTAQHKDIIKDMYSVLVLVLILSLFLPFIVQLRFDNS